MEAYWKDDFRPLQSANKAVLAALRADEEAPDADLYRRIISTSNIVAVASSSSSSSSFSATATTAPMLETNITKGSHLYYLADNYTGSSNSGGGSSGGAEGQQQQQQQASTPPAPAAFTFPASPFAAPPQQQQAQQYQQQYQQQQALVKSVPVIRLSHKQSLPMVDALKRQLSTHLQSCLFMGFFVPVQLAWMTVDDKLYLFPIIQSSSGSSSSGGSSSSSAAAATFTCFTNSRKQPILAVALVRPKPGIFKSMVQWCIVLTTPEEVLLLALVDRSSSSSSNSNSQEAAAAATSAGNRATSSGSFLQLVETSFTMSSDMLQFTAVVGTNTGRIFLGANDGSLHEMIYEDHSVKQQQQQQQQNGITSSSSSSFVQEQLNQFYNGNQSLPSVLYPTAQDANAAGGTLSSVLSMGKRTLQAISGFDNSSNNEYDDRRYGAGNQGPRKCRKLNRTSQASNSHGTTITTALVPEVLQQAASFLLGRPAATAGGCIVSLQMDEERQCLYSLTQRGWIATFDVSRPNAAPLASLANIPQLVRLYLETVGRGQVIAPSSSWAIRFPGGSMAASAGVGGMQGAREILKLADGVGAAQRRGGGGRNAGSTRPLSSSSSALPHPILTPVALHVIPRRESSRLTLMAVTSGGLRLYLSSLPPNTLGSGSSSSIVHGIVGMHSSAARGGSTSTNPWGPSNQLTLCHIRAPPPVSSVPSNSMPSSSSTFTNTGGRTSTAFGRNDFATLNGNNGYAAINTVDSGMKPQVSAALNQTTQRVDASFYDAGHWVAAMEDQANNKGSDLILSVAPDSLRRIAEPDEIITNNINRTTKTQMMAPGGLAETLSLPMSSAYGDDSADTTSSTRTTTLLNNMTTPVLLGGLVWEIASMQDMNVDDSTRQRRQQVLSLTLNSQTPSDADLDVGLPPAFCPPSKIRTQQRPPGRLAQGGGVNNSSGSSRALTVPRSSPWQIFFNALSSRPVNYGLSLQRPEAEPFVEQDYRISNCTGVDGFSLTAAEMGRPSPTTTTTTTTTAASPASAPRVVAKSARLRPSLLRPPVVPLNQFATHHLSSTKRQIVALNVQGLHYFEFNTILSSLADALIAAGDNTESDATVTSFFTGYGYKEGCSMCLALAIGAGPAGGDAVYNQQLRSAALKAALARAFAPKLVVLSEYQNPTISETMTDPFIPRGFTFCPSALSEGLTMLFSRLARPVWHKPYIVVTEGRDIKLAWSGGIKTAPAKVEILLGEETLEEIRGPLRSLLKLVREAFAPAVRAVPGTMQRQDMSMDIDMVANQSQYLTQAMQHHSHRRAGTGVGANNATVLTARDAEEIARLVEERNIHSLYRLMARAVQFLNLVSLLQKAENMVELPHVDWGLLHGLTISQLVQNPEGQDRLEALLNSLVVSPASAGANAARSAQANKLARQFAEQCYLYFPPASQFAHEGLRLASEALSIPAPSSQRDRLAFEAASNLCKAARHWHSPPLITGRIIRSNVKESYEQIARRALQYESPLATATDVLIKLGNVAGAVDICLTTAANFKSGNVAGREKLQIQGAFPWEHDLYHKNRQGNGNEPTSSGYGTTVTAQDAIDTCHALIFYYLSSLLSLNKEWALRMLSACIAAPDTLFLADLFSHLLERNETDTLLMIDSPHLDAWLSKRNDSDLLYSYYTVQNRHVDAARVIFDWACSKSIKLSLGVRIAGLSKALNSYRVAAHDRNLHNQGISNEDVVTKMVEVQDTLHLAKLQFRTLDAIRSKPELGRLLDAESREKLGFTLVPASDLYNEFSAKLSLYGICLVILHTCRYDDATNIFTLWKNCVCEELVPCATRSQQLYDFLQDFVQDVDLGSGIKLLSAASSEQSEFQIFEDGRWILRLQEKVVNLGKELFGTGADYTFPVDYLLMLLESLRQSVPAAFRTTAWSLMTLVDAGVPYLVVLSAFERFSQQDGRVFVGGGGDDHNAEDKLAAPVELLEYWLGKCRSPVGESGEQTNAAHTELSRAIVTGEVMQTIYSLRSRVDQSNAPVFATLRDRLASIEEAVQTY